MNPTSMLPDALKKKTDVEMPAMSAWRMNS